MPSKTVKFDNFDRAKVKEEIERIHGVKLQKKSNRDIELVSASGKLFWIIGGTGEWHGIPPEMINTKESDATDGFFVIASKGKTKIRIFEGPLLPFIQNKHLLTVNQKEIYQFDVKITGNRLSVKHVPTIIFSLISEIEYSDSEKAQDRVYKKVAIELDKLSASDLQKLLASLEKEQ